ncbi:hypothetical protein EC968_002685 [Mortierella alpina]|nr:hypothetical protein EC968_002685 [Mortierella alpina]
MPDPQPISNRQRKIMERQAERNREMTAAKRAETRTPFREAELQFLSRHPPPDYSKALDFRQPAELLLADPKIKQVPLRKQMGQFSDLFGVYPASGTDHHQQEYAYLHEDHPGLIYIPKAFTPSAQRTLIKACLKDYSQHPNKSNLDTHYLVPDSGVWRLHENVYTGIQSLEDPTVYVQRKAAGDAHAGGYGSDDDDDDNDNDSNNDDGNNTDKSGSKDKSVSPAQPRKKPKSTQPSVRTLVPITDGTPTVPDHIPKVDPEPSAQVPILPPAQLIRRMRWITLGYQYHWPSKTYHFDQNAPFPKELSVLSKAVVEAVDGVGPFPYPSEDFIAEAGVINYYQLKDRLMGHVDRSELNKDAPLVSFSFGHSCIYLLGGSTRETSPTPILLQSVPRIIEGTLPSYLQARPEEPEWDIYADYLAEARINLNIRQVYPPDHQSTAIPASTS